VQKVQTPRPTSDPIAALSAEAGVAFPSFGEATVPAQLSVRIAAGIPIAMTDHGAIVPGASVWLTPLPWGEHTEMQTALVANITARYEVATDLQVRVDAGTGALFLSKLDEGNPFTFEGRRASGTLAMFHLRGSVGVDYWLNEIIAVSATPLSFGASPPKSGLRRDIVLIHQLDIVAGLRIHL
jgi:hypothetical protein